MQTWGLKESKLIQKCKNCRAKYRKSMIPFPQSQMSFRIQNFSNLKKIAQCPHHVFHKPPSTLWHSTRNQTLQRSAVKFRNIQIGSNRGSGYMHQFTSGFPINYLCIKLRKKKIFVFRDVLV